MTKEQIKEDFAKLLANTPIYMSIAQPAGESGKDGFVQLPNDNPDMIAHHFEQWSQKELEVLHHYNSIDKWSIYYKEKYQDLVELAK